jgi:type II secretory pathway pseudopilin PulG
MNTRIKPARPSRGMSLVELMVGITIGLFVVAAAATLVTAQLSDNRKLLTETQVQQDLRASMDIITRQLRRAGALEDNFAQSGMAERAGALIGGKRTKCPTAAGELCSSVTPGSAVDDHDTFVSSEAPFDNNVKFYFMLNPAERGDFGFKLENGVIKSKTGAGGWQELTDPGTMKVTKLEVRTLKIDSEELPCPKPCPVAGGGFNTACWPQLSVRTIRVTIEAESIIDPAVRRQIQNEVRLRNDEMQFRDPINATPLVCPA